MNDSHDPFKELDKELDNLRRRAQDQAPLEVTTETVIECDDELLTADTELTSDSDILAEFPPSDDERPSKQDLCHAIDVLLTFSLFVRVDHDSFKTNIKTILRIVDRDRLLEKRQGLLTDYFQKLSNSMNSVAVS